MQHKVKEVKPTRTKTLAPIRLTLDQFDWLKEEGERQGNTMSTVVRGLIQANLDQIGNKEL